ncbi:pyridoxal phosphate-dependent aminotransferase [Croceimicrobium hydrocarbonivorans]|uniref:Aminotransferase n=1 Tax=Croceimicrobium hydrocarbonivorans TaxID=2761580 RepID=A0A7H0VGK4_9FLAO|nr:pyridoxal phosphate-dependent aminotransferase [Croceimicrobium hydrocarbonivorans]QNR24852.1 pyridoxal phosphate-dependent aminotransferase [Croceimicrobium hydrocarbonivorans]
MNKISQRILDLSESATIAMSRRSREMREQGLDVISLSLGEPDFETPDFVRQAAKEAIDIGYSHYPPIPGYQDLRQAIAHKLKRDNGLDYTANQIVVSTGAKQSLANVILCTVDPGDEVLLPAPYWVSYYEQIRLAGGTPVIIPTAIENDFKVTRDDLEKYHTDKTKLVIFSSPCNPSGSVFSKEDLAEIADYLKAHPNVIAISDEIYELINFKSQHVSLASFSEIYDQVVTVNGLSKGFAMTGWRIGYIAAPQEIADACVKMQGQFTSATSSIAQRAALAALQADPSEMDYMKEAFEERRAKVGEWLREIPGLKVNQPEGAFYFFPDVSALLGSKIGDRTINDSADLCMYLLEEALVALVPGDAFGSPECIRISYASSLKDLETALSRIKAAIEKLDHA